MSVKLENVVLASPEQIEFIIEGMRNPMNSWEKSDTCFKENVGCLGCYEYVHDICDHYKKTQYVSSGKVGSNDHSLMQRLSNAGTEHRKYMRMMPVYVRITAPLYWWKEFDTYKIGTVANSCSTMHKIAAKEFTLDDFSTEHLFTEGQNVYCNTAPVTEDDLFVNSTELMQITIEVLNQYRKDFLDTTDKKYWWQMIQLLPSSYNQTRNVMLNYEVLANIYRQRQNHKLDEWREVCKWIETLPYSELITEGEERKLYSDTQVLAETGQELKRGLRAGIRMVDENDTKWNRCEKLRDCLNSGGLVDVTTGNDITKGRYINKPGYDCPKRRKNNER